MNNQNNLMAALEAEYAAKKAELEKVNALAEACAAELETLAKADGKLADAKNIAADAATEKGSVWDAVLSIAGKVVESTPAANREQVFTTLLSEYLTPKQGPDGKAMKLTTVGMYASTGRKVVTELMTKQAYSEEALSELGYAKVRKLFKSEAQRQLEEDVAKCGEMLRYIAKHGNKETVKGTIAALMEAITVHYNPIKAAKDANTRAAKADREIRDNAQQHPTAPTVVETVAGNLAATAPEEAAKAA